MQETVTIPKRDFYRMVNILEKLELLVTAKTTTWLDTTQAMALLHCGRTKLWELAKNGVIKYKKVGKMMYCKKSINEYIETIANK